MRNIKPLLKLVCHQIPDRCYHMCGKTLLVCSRCLGTYIGFLFTFIILVIIYTPFKAGLPLSYIILMFIPMAIDGITQVLGLRDSNNTIRYFTGYIAGIGLGYLVFTLFAVITFTGSYIPLMNPASITTILVLIPMFLLFAVLRKFNNSDNKFLKNMLNSLTVLSLAILILSIFIIGVSIIQAILSE